MIKLVRGKDIKNNWSDFNYWWFVACWFNLFSGDQRRGKLPVNNG